MSLKFQIAIALILFLAAWHLYSVRPVRRLPGILVQEEPMQSMYPKPTTSIKFKETTLELLASYHIRARIISTETYSSDHGASVSPIDFCLSWGRMSDSDVLKNLNFIQYGRFCDYTGKRMPPIPPLEINSHIANMHLIPADKVIEHLLKITRVGQIVTLDGDLVRVLYKDGGIWMTSLVRTDTGGGSCEVMLVKSIQAEN